MTIKVNGTTIDGVMHNTDNKVWDFVKATILDSIVNVNENYKGIQSVDISDGNAGLLAKWLIAELVDHSAEDLAKWGLALFNKASAEELFNLKLSDVDGKTYTVAFKIADNTIIEYTVKLNSDKALEDTAKTNLQTKVESAVDAIKVK